MRAWHQRFFWRGGCQACVGKNYGARVPLMPPGWRPRDLSLNHAWLGTASDSPDNAWLGAASSELLVAMVSLSFVEVVAEDFLAFPLPLQASFAVRPLEGLFPQR